MRRKDNIQELRHFLAWLNQEREARQISMEQLCQGLCTARELAYLERGERFPDNLVQDRLLERLGTDAADHEYLLDYPEYERWQGRQRILHSIAHDNMERAGACLKQYEDGIDRKNSLERQFCLDMRFQIRRREGAPEGELLALCREAAEQTVPEPEGPIDGRTLSPQEINLLLELERYRREGQRPERYFDLMKYLETREKPGAWGVKLYPKAVYYWCCSRMSRRSRCREEIWEELEFCDRALEMLRRGSRLYWFVELLTVREKLLEQLVSEIRNEEGREPEASGEELSGEDRGWEELQELSGKDRGWEELGKDLSGETEGWEELQELSREDGGWKELQRFFGETGEWKELQEFSGEREEWRNRLEKLYRENRAWKELLTGLYREYGVPAETFHDSFLYVVNYVQCVNDVIRIRREMLGISRAELCMGICDIKTLRRLERRETVPQRAVTGPLLERLGLPGEYRYCEVITGTPEVKRLLQRLRRSHNGGRREEAEQCLKALREKIDLRRRENRQMLLIEEALSDWRRGSLEKEAYLRKLGEALEQTLPFQAFLKEGEKYLTTEEQTCIRDMLCLLDQDSETYLSCLKRFEEIYRPHIQGDTLETVFGAVEYIIMIVGSARGNRGEFDQADAYSSMLARESLYFRRIFILSDAIYDQWWNYDSRRKKEIPAMHVKDGRQELNKCILLSKLKYHKKEEKFFHKKLFEILEQDELS